MGDLIFDVAHNPPAFERLVEALQIHFPGKKFPFYLSFSKDKDWKKCVEIIAPHATEIAFIKNNNPRLIPGDFPLENIREGVVAGSFYIMADVLEAVLNLKLHPSCVACDQSILHSLQARSYIKHFC